MNDHAHHDHDQPAFVATLTRRRALGALAAAGFGVLAACGNDAEQASSSTTSAPTSTSSGTSQPATTQPASTQTATTVPGTTAEVSSTAAAECLTFPEETNGPFPADGSNDNGEGQLANVLADPRIVRSDLTANLDGSDQQSGVPLAMTMVITGKDGCTPMPGAAVYAWHCSRDGHYSVYSAGMNGGDYSESTWFRGVQIAGDDGSLTFNTIFPGRYQGRAVHIHFEVYEDNTFANLLLTSQIGFDDGESDAVYATDTAYSSSLSNPTYNAQDNVFRDGDGSQIVDVSDPSAALTASVVIGL